MKISLLIFTFIFAVFAAPLRAQDAPPAPAPAAAEAIDAATRQDEFKRLNSMIEELMAAQSAQQKKMETLTSEFNKLRDESAKSDKLDKFATKDDFETLTTKLKELDKQRQGDRDTILAEIKKLIAIADKPRPKGKAEPKSEPKSESKRETAGTKPPVEPPPGSFAYEIQPGDTLSGIAEGVRKQHNLKVTVAMILEANPGLKPEKLPVGKKINIPDPTKKVSQN